jgi:hypothetical protein
MLLATAAAASDAPGWVPQWLARWLPSWSTTQDIAAGGIVIVAAMAGVLITLLTFPGTWLAAAVALGCWVWRPDLFSWWSMGLVLALCVLAEVAEFFSAAAGSKSAGGTRAGAWGSIVGALVGLVAGSIVLAFLPIIGSIIGAVVGSGVGAMLAERRYAKRTWSDAAKSGGGAAVGRALSVVVKTAFAAAIALVLVLAVLIPGF